MKKAAHNTNKSLKTLYLYAIIVLLLILVSLVVKVFYIVQQNKFDSTHHFTLAIIEHNNVKEILSFQPQTPAVSELIIQNNNIPYGLLAKNYGIETDGYIQTGDNLLPGSDMSNLLWSSIIHTASWQCNVTIFDKVRLLLLVRSITSNNKIIKNISLTTQNFDVNATIMTALTDQDVATENTSIQIINATNVSGLGQRLARVLTNLGANVIDIATAQKTQEKSSIAYYENESYTLNRVQRILDIPVRKLTKRPIAAIVITIGKDKVNTSEF